MAPLCCLLALAMFGLSEAYSKSEFIQAKKDEAKAIASDAQKAYESCSVQSACYQSSREDCGTEPQRWNSLLDNTVDKTLRQTAIATCGNEMGPDSKCVGALGGKNDEICNGIGCLDVKRLNYEEGYIRWPPKSSTATSKLFKTICWLNRLNPTFRKHDSTREDKDVLRGWQYFGDEYTGAINMHPGFSGNGRKFRNDKGCCSYDNSDDCEIYDPRFRSWYPAAAMGPKDIILIIDQTVSRAAIKRGAKNVLGDLSINDYFAVIDLSSTSTEISGSQKLVRANQKNIADYHGKIDALNHGIRGDWDLAFSRAKSIFQQSTNVDENSSGCTRVVLFVSMRYDYSVSVSTITADMNAVNAKVVSIVPYSGSDRASAQIIACNTNGIYRRTPLSGNYKIDDIMRRYYEVFAAAADRNSVVRWSNPYEDAGGLGEMITAVAPAFDDAGYFLGVAGTDVLMSELLDYGSKNDILKELRQSSKQCVTFTALTSPYNCPVRRVHSSYSSGCSISLGSCASNPGTGCGSTYRLKHRNVLCEAVGTGTLQPPTDNILEKASKDYNQLACCGCFPPWVLPVIITVCVLAVVGVACFFRIKYRNGSLLKNSAKVTNSGETNQTTGMQAKVGPSPPATATPVSVAQPTPIQSPSAAFVPTSAAQGTVPQPRMVQMQPGMVQMQPGMVQMQPGMVQMQPGMVQPGMVQPGMVQPGMVQPGMVQMQPGMVQPGMVQPGAVQPGMMPAATAQMTPQQNA